MYNYLKKALLVISLLTIPSMNTVLKAMEDEDREAHHAIQRVPTFGEQLKDMIFDIGSATKGGAQGIMNGAYNLAVCFNEKPVETCCALLMTGVVTLAAATTAETTVKTEVQECDCTCLRDPLHSSDLYIGRRGDLNLCKNDCIGLGYYKESKCSPFTKRDDLW